MDGCSSRLHCSLVIDWKQKTNIMEYHTNPLRKFSLKLVSMHLLTIMMITIGKMTTSISMIAISPTIVPMKTSVEIEPVPRMEEQNSYNSHC